MGHKSHGTPAQIQAEMTQAKHPIKTRAGAAPFRRAIRAAGFALAFAATAGFALPPQPAAAQGRPGLSIIRDTEIEQLMRDYTRPLLKAANLGQQNIEVVIINDRRFNAFVMDGRRIFVNAGAIMEAQVPNEIIGVLAHEIGHIQGGHLSRLRQEMARAQTQAILAMILGMGAAVAASRGGADIGNASAAILGPQSAVLRSFLAYQRSQEEQADRAGVRLLDATGQSSKGMSETFKRMADQALFAAQRADPYFQSHPMPAERVQALSTLARTSPNWDRKDSPEMQLRHDLARAKLYGFLEPYATTLRRYPQSNNSLPARYARAISTFRHSNLRSAVAQIDALIAERPNQAAFHELKGQALLEGGQPAAAIAPLRRAVQLSQHPALVQVMLAKALNATGNKQYAQETVRLLRVALAREPELPDGHMQLAMAYGRMGDLGQADLAAAQAAFARGEHKTASMLANRAKSRLPVGSPAWIRADDLATFKPPKKGFGR